MRHCSRRVETPHQSGDCGDLDIMVVRELDLRRSRPIGRSLENLDELTAGLVVTRDLGALALKVYGSKYLKTLVGKKTKKKYLIDTEKLEPLCTDIIGENEFKSLTLAVDNPEMPFFIDNDGQVQVFLEDNTPQLKKDRELIAEGVRKLLSEDDKQEFDNETFFQPPSIVVADIQFQMLRQGGELDRYLLDPDTFLAERLKDAIKVRLKDGLIIPKEVFPERVTYGGLRVMIRPRDPNKEKLRVVEASTSCIFDKDNIRKIRDVQICCDEHERIV